jgi:hypothetical protein
MVGLGIFVYGDIVRSGILRVIGVTVIIACVVGAAIMWAFRNGRD